MHVNDRGATNLREDSPPCLIWWGRGSNLHLQPQVCRVRLYTWPAKPSMLYRRADLHYLCRTLLEPSVLEHAFKHTSKCTRSDLIQNYHRPGLSQASIVITNLIMVILADLLRSLGSCTRS